MRFRRTPVRASLPASTLALVLVLAPIGGCADLEVTNLNEPDLSDVAADVSLAEALIAGSFETWHDAQYSYTGPSLFLSTASFQHSTPRGCGFNYYSRIPRNPIANDRGHPYYDLFTKPWHVLYGALAAVGDGLTILRATELDPELDRAERRRLEAFARFVQGVGHGSLALLYDQGFVREEDADLASAELVSYDS